MWAYHPAMKCWIFAGEVLLVSLLCIQPTAALTPSQLLVTEVQTAGATPAHKTHEFIEIHGFWEVVGYL
jgi:hypothetical protein